MSSGGASANCSRGRRCIGPDQAAAHAEVALAGCEPAVETRWHEPCCRVRAMPDEPTPILARHTRIGMAALSFGVAAMMGLASAVGIFARGDGAARRVTSIRGEVFHYATSGVYAFNAERVVAEGIGWDWFTLAVATPAMLAALPLLVRGSLRGRMFALGLLGYAFYQYLMYAMTWAFGPLFPLFIGLYATSLAGIVWIVSTIDLGAVARTLGPGFPRRRMVALCSVMALMLVGMWTQRVAVGLRSETPQLFGMTTMVVQALDLGLIVPLCLWTAVTTWRRRPVGYLLSALLVVKGFAMAAAIVAMLLSAWAIEGEPELPALIVFILLAAMLSWLGLRVYTAAEPRTKVFHAESVAL
ncbi:hypothetical protein [Nannocystis pusilla]|uniref:hypothetical protein n=1 Tax=Nannocystis pusilla TaxID=889268 RepID=UPI003DA20F51